MINISVYTKESTSSSGIVFHEEESKVIRIGREHSNDIVLDSMNVSRIHAHLRYKSQELFIRDLGSTNGTTVAAYTINANTGDVKLNPSDSIIIAEFIITVGFDFNSKICIPKNMQKLIVSSNDSKSTAPMDIVASAVILERKRHDPRMDTLRVMKSEILTENERPPTIHSLRALINTIFRKSSALDAFLIDHFRDVWKDVSKSMERNEKLNLLLESMEPRLVLFVVKRRYPEQFKKFKEIIEFEPE